MSHQRSSRNVFVGNIPYDYTEEQLTEIFKEVGPVVSFRLVFDRESGKPRGYGFCEYQDAETAASAVRNLNAYEVGGRELRVDYADSDKDDTHNRGTGTGSTNFQHDENRKGFNNRQNMPNSQPPSSQQTPTPTSQQQPVNPSSNQSSVESIQNIVNMVPQRELLELMSQMKTLVETNPVAARNLLMMNPQLSYAIFQALLSLNIVDPIVIQRILQVHMNDSNSSMQNQPISQQPQLSQIPQSQPQIPISNSNIGINTPKPQQQPTQSSQPSQPPQSQQQPFVNADGLQEQQKQLLLQVLSLTQEQINSLPPDQRENVLTLKAQLMGQAQT